MGCWEAIGAIGEILGATAVVVSLIIIAVQIHKNTRANQTAGYRALIDALGQLGLTVATDRELEQIIFEAEMEPDSVSEEHWRTFTRITWYAFGQAAYALMAKNNGVLPDHLWQGIEAWGAFWVDLPGYKKFWSENRLAHAPEFREYIDARQFSSNDGQ